MKLIFCNLCHDIFSLNNTYKKCNCGKSSGRYINDIDAEIKGDSIVLGIDNKSFLKALVSKNITKNKGASFNAFIISEDAKTIKRIE